MITYKVLLENLQKFSEEQLAMTVTVTSGCDEDAEFFGCHDIVIATDEKIEAATDGVLDEYQPIIMFKE